LDLVDLGFADWEDPAENFGPETHNVIRHFQDFYGYHVNGVIDQQMLERIDEELEKEISRGLNRPDVERFKLKLVDLGFADWSSPSTNFGPETEERVIAFQEYYDTNRTDGVVDEETLT
ncbi:peptidoglycan-binding domain-containing protein, partial [Alkalibacillus haloalkaliphilus]|uniref:peptidoglycan-binding domain-containing protein n=1 Tax=Alkalibacillus haloalkaliphilus TaxID=94136 RepID=UPI0029354469